MDEKGNMKETTLKQLNAIPKKERINDFKETRPNPLTCVRNKISMLYLKNVGSNDWIPLQESQNNRPFTWGGSKGTNLITGWTVPKLPKQRIIQSKSISFIELENEDDESFDERIYNELSKLSYA